MRLSRNGYAGGLFFLGGGLFALGVLLLLIKLLVWMAWYAAGTIALVGLVTMLIGAALGSRGRRPAHEIQD